MVHMVAGPRHRARVLALQALYEADQTRHLPGESLERLAADTASPPDVAGFARGLVAGVGAHRADIDDVIAGAAPQWPVEQLAAIDRNILRIAIYEVRFDNETPPRVAVSEAVELAKAYGSDNSARFVNGVLGTTTAGATR
jgi:N utilization substance protein B